MNHSQFYGAKVCPSVLHSCSLKHLSSFQMSCNTLSMNLSDTSVPVSRGSFSSSRSSTAISIFTPVVGAKDRQLLTDALNRVRSEDLLCKAMEIIERGKGEESSGVESGNDQEVIVIDLDTANEQTLMELKRLIASAPPAQRYPHSPSPCWFTPSLSYQRTLIFFRLSCVPL